MTHGGFTISWPSTEISWLLIAQWRHQEDTLYYAPHKYKVLISFRGANKQILKLNFGIDFLTSGK